MLRREFLGGAGGALAASTRALGGQNSKVTNRLGLDLFSVRSQGWTAFQHLDYAARNGVKVVHFSEIRFVGGLDKPHLAEVRAYAAKLGIQIEIGMRSICPTSKLFDPAQGTAEEQLGRMADAAVAIGSSLVRAVLGSSQDRAEGRIEQHIENTVKVLRASRSRVRDAGLKVAIENHSGDMQGRELRMLIEAAGPDFVGACLDSGNPCWTLEDPHVTLEAVAPYVLTSHIRDSAVWRVPDGIAVAWVRMGEGNVGIEDYVRKYSTLCPGRALSPETIVTGPRIFAISKPEFWRAYDDVRAGEFLRFLAIADRGTPRPAPPKLDKAEAAAQEVRDSDASIAYLKKLL
jgi:3-oxoisoapionate decarboxylase